MLINEIWHLLLIEKFIQLSIKVSIKVSHRVQQSSIPPRKPKYISPPEPVMEPMQVETARLNPIHWSLMEQIASDIASEAIPSGCPPDHTYELNTLSLSTQFSPEPFF